MEFQLKPFDLVKVFTVIVSKELGCLVDIIDPPVAFPIKDSFPFLIGNISENCNHQLVTVSPSFNGEEEPINSPDIIAFREMRQTHIQLFED